jgi:subtilisin
VTALDLKKMHKTFEKANMTEKLYVFLPDDGYEQTDPTLSLAKAAPLLSEMSANTGVVSSPSIFGKVIKKIDQSGACLVSLDDDGGRIAPKVVGGAFHPLVYYSPAIASARIGRRSLTASSGPAAANFLTLKVVDPSGTPVSGAVVGVRIPGSRDVVPAITNGNGVATLPIRARTLKVKQLLVEPGFGGHWGYLSGATKIQDGQLIIVERIDLSKNLDALRQWAKSENSNDGNGVIVGVVDTGVGPHPDLQNASGDYDTSDGHGSHVAGIIGGRGAGANSGVAPGVSIKSYRVFDDPTTGLAANFEIHSAILRAVEDGCDLINLSLKINNLDYEPVVGRAIKIASDKGSLVFAAAGNDFGSSVAFPARNVDVVAVAAMGDEAGLPQDCYDRWAISRIRSPIKSSVFFAKFSNQGPEIDIIAPGAGVVSTVPGGYAPMSGTSMACPAAVGAVARLLSGNPNVLAMPRHRKRRDAILALIHGRTRKLGFGPNREGRGLVD